MSLALFKDRLDAGEVDETVRAHLRGCDECRAYYDRLLATARALGDEGAAEERRRLEQSLAQPRGAGGRDEGLGAPLAVAALVLVAAVAAFVFLKPKARDEVLLRGGPADDLAGYSLRIYGKDAPGQRIHLVADLPGSKEVSVPLRAELQYFVKPAGKPVIVETRGAQGRSVTVRSTPSGDELAPVGRAFQVGDFGPGNIEVCVAQPPGGQQTLDEAVKAGATKFCTTLWVSP